MSSNLPFLRGPTAYDRLRELQRRRRRAARIAATLFVLNLLAAIAWVLISSGATEGFGG